MSDGDTVSMLNAECKNMRLFYDLKIQKKSQRIEYGLQCNRFIKERKKANRPKLFTSPG